MRHNLTIAGSAYRLRPITLYDAQFIVVIRTHPSRSRFINYTPSDVEQQREWIERYFEKPNDYYFLIEDANTREPEGTLAIYDVNVEKKTAEWGRWVLRPGSKAALPSITLVFRAAFENLHLDLLRTHTVLENRSVIAILERAGMREARKLENYVQIGNRSYDVIEHQILRADWLRRRSSSANS